MDFDGWTIPVATLLLGQLSLFVLEWARHWLTRKQRRDDARDDFQRQTLLELQESLYQLVLVLGDTKVEYEKAKKGLPPSYEWSTSRTPLITGGEAMGRIALLTERVRDDDIRRLVIECFEHFRELGRTPKIFDEPDFEARLDGLWDRQRRANKRMGTVLRSL